MKRYWPIILTLLCWLLVLFVPVTRLGTLGAYDNWGLFADRRGVERESTVNFYEVSSATLSLLERYPNDRNVDAYAATEFIDDSNQTECGQPSDFDYLAKRYPDDPFVVVLCLRNALAPTRRSQIIWLQDDQTPMPGRTRVPRVVWVEIIDLARRGQRLEPQNSYFDCILLYALLATRQDAEARAVLIAAAKKPAFNTHVSDENLTRIDIYQRLYGAALPPDALFQARKQITFGEALGMTDAAKWTMELVIADRAKGRHERAFATALNLMHLGRTVRRESDSYSGSMRGRNFEAFAMNHTAFIPERLLLDVSDPLGYYQRDSNGLYAYAKEQGRDDIARAVSTNWQQRLDWDEALPYDDDWHRPISQELIAIAVANRFRAFLLNTLPFTLVLCLVFGRFMLRFPLNPEETISKPLYHNGAKVGINLVLLALIATTAATVGHALNFESHQLLNNLLITKHRDLLEMAPIWFNIGLPAILLFVAFYLADQWQATRQAPVISLMDRIKSLNAPPEDGLANFDLTWAAGLMVRLTYWIFVLSTVTFFYTDNFNWGNDYYQIRERLGGFESIWEQDVAILIGGFFCPFFVLSYSWMNWPYDVHTLRLGFRNAFQMTLGYLVAASVVYTFVTFAILPLNLWVVRDFEAMVRKGELQSKRAELKLPSDTNFVHHAFGEHHRFAKHHSFFSRVSAKPIASA